MMKFCRVVRLANKIFLSNGITSLQDTTWSNNMDHWEFYNELKATGILSPRITMMPGSDAISEFNKHGLRTQSGDNHLRLGAAKIAIDESTGRAHPPQEEINEHALFAHRAAFQLALHVSDLYTLEASLNSLQFILQNDVNPLLRPRLEHCLFCPKEFIPTIKRLKAIIITQPIFLYYGGETFRTDCSKEQIKWLFPLHSFRDQGIDVCFSSDTPLYKCNPVLNIYTAVTRKDSTGQNIVPEESIKINEAIKMHTYFPAYASFEEKIKGSITPGKIADLVILSHDTSKINPEEIMNIHPVLTMMDGEIVWEKED